VAGEQRGRGEVLIYPPTAGCLDPDVVGGEDAAQAWSSERSQARALDTRMDGDRDVVKRPRPALADQHRSSE
jgi:hypothetical protein